MNEKVKTKQPTTLREALNLFQSDGIAAKKTDNNPFHKSKYASLQEVIQAVNEAAKYGLSFSQKINYKTICNDHKTFTDMWVETVLSFNGSEETLTSKYPIIPQKNIWDDSQKLGSAITYAKRYALQSIYGIPSEDDDGNKNFIKKETSYKPTSNQNQGKMTPNTQDVLKVIDESNPPVYTLVLPGDKEKHHDTLETLAFTFNDLMLVIINNPDKDKKEKVKTIEKAFKVNEKVMNQLKDSHKKTYDELTTKFENFKNG